MQCFIAIIITIAFSFGISAQQLSPLVIDDALKQDVLPNHDRKYLLYLKDFPRNSLRQTEVDIEAKLAEIRIINAKRVKRTEKDELRKAAVKELTALRKRIVDIKRGKVDPTPLIRINDAKIGDYARINLESETKRLSPNAALKTFFEYKLVVVQVISKSEMIVKYTIRSTVPLARVRSVKEKHDLFWVSGYPTNGLFDDESIMPNGVFNLTGTRSYTTVNNAKKTIRHLQFINPTFPR